MPQHDGTTVKTTSLYERRGRRNCLGKFSTAGVWHRVVRSCQTLHLRRRHCRMAFGNLTWHSFADLEQQHEDSVLLISQA